MVTLLGDGTGATTPITPFPVPFSSPGPAPHGPCSTLRAPDPISAKAMTHVPRICASPGPHPAGTGPGHSQAAPRQHRAACAGVCDAKLWAAPLALCSGRALPALAAAVPGEGRFTGCHSQGQRSAGVRKSISERSLSTSFNLMKPLFVKAAALLAIPLKPIRAQRPALKEQEGVPFPFTFAIQQAPKNKYTTHRNMTWDRHRCRAVSPGPGEMKLRGKEKLPGSAMLRDVAVSLGRKVTEARQKLGDAEKLAAKFK